MQVKNIWGLPLGCRNQPPTTTPTPHTLPSLPYSPPPPTKEAKKSLIRMFRILRSRTERPKVGLSMVGAPGGREERRYLLEGEKSLMTRGHTRSVSRRLKSRSWGMGRRGVFGEEGRGWEMEVSTVQDLNEVSTVKELQIAPPPTLNIHNYLHTRTRAHTCTQRHTCTCTPRDTHVHLIFTVLAHMHSNMHV